MSLYVPNPHFKHVAAPSRAKEPFSHGLQMVPSKIVPGSHVSHYVRVKDAF